MKRLEEMSNMFQSSGVECHPPEPKSQTEGNEDLEDKEQPWEMVMEKKHFKLWRRPIMGTHLYQYRGKEHTKNTTFTQVATTDTTIATAATEQHHALPSEPQASSRAFDVNAFLHRVEDMTLPAPKSHHGYSVVLDMEVVMDNSNTLIFDVFLFQNGFDYLLIYSDNPQTVFPRYCVSWMVSSGMPDFLEKLHMATLKAKNMEIKVKDYISAKPLEINSEAKTTTQSSERKNEGSCGPARIEYA
ncbi:PREDICTED: stAR-related lipid transfer protein 7, mitochondrial [Galeopterus variegatus]|uniref:StAR-related lipid transfer protein 7, mitochondrial n=1 Tax=Galeopterus variegatus TaxID=482537 RepID=A0ABM0QCQ6_GALVR|nr:PREDICTED: stAR-related lipid transfer protein 7, mitochondrial [Galeopterus variegatus]